MKLVVGLGNPGKQYERTRHNVGWMVLERCCEKRGVEWPGKKKLEARYAFHGLGKEQICFVEPLTYMNESGQSVRQFLDFYQVEAPDVLVLCDEMQLPVGQLRLKPGGSSGGQKGLESVIRHLGTQQFPRLRVGIGMPPPFMDAADWVLGRFGGDDEKAIAEAVEKAADAVDSWVREGVEKTQQRYNAKPPRPAGNEGGGDAEKKKQKDAPAPE